MSSERNAMAELNSWSDARPLPAYNSIDNAVASEQATILTLGGKLSVAQNLKIVNIASARIENRKVSIQDAVTKNQEHLVTFHAMAPSHEVASMELHRHSAAGEVEAKVTFPAVDGVLAAISIGGKKTNVLEQKAKTKSGDAEPSSSKKDNTASRPSFAIGDLTWRSSDQYLHTAKGHSRAGDLELVTAAGDVVAVFLNEWSGSPSAKELGTLWLTEHALKSTSGTPVVALAIMSLIVIVTHISWRTRDGAKEFLKEIMQGGLLLCSVM